MKDHVIKVLTPEHGAEVIKYFKSLGISTTHKGTNCESDGDSYIYYGVIDGRFDDYRLEYVKGKKVPIKTLEECMTKFPRVMLVSNSIGSEWTKRVVIAYKNNRYIAWINATSFEDAESVTTTCTWKYATEIPAEPSKRDILIAKAEELIKKAEELKEEARNL